MIVACGSAGMALERRQDVVPERRLFGGLDLGRYSTSDAPDPRSRALVVDDKQGGVHDRRRKAGAVGPADVPVVQMQAAGAEDVRREVELLAPVLDGRAAEEALRPARSSRPPPARPPTGTRRRDRMARLQAALIVERHRGHLAERVLAVEHPAVGAREQRIGHVAEALRRAARRGVPPGPCPGSTAAAGRRG